MQTSLNCHFQASSLKLTPIRFPLSFEISVCTPDCDQTKISGYSSFLNSNWYHRFLLLDIFDFAIIRE